MPTTPEFRAFYARTVRPLAAHLRGIGLRQQQDLEEVIQETYLEAHKSWASLRDEQASLAWLLTIGRRRYFRRCEERREAGAGTPQFVGFESAERVTVSESRSPAELATDRQLCAGILRLIEAIPQNARQKAIRMFFLEDHSLNDISQATGAGVSTLTTWMSRFRSEARRMLSQAEKHRHLSDQRAEDSAAFLPPRRAMP